MSARGASGAIVVYIHTTTGPAVASPPRPRHGHRQRVTPTQHDVTKSTIVTTQPVRAAQMAATQPEIDAVIERQQSATLRSGMVALEEGGGGEMAKVGSFAGAGREH